MEGIETTPITPEVTPAAATPAPTATPTATPAAATPMPSMDNDFGDGSSDKSLMGIIKSLNWLEITFGIIGATALYYTIYYYRYNMTVGDKTKTEMQNRIDALEIKLAEIQEEEENKNTPQTLF